jgi:hypothetical protein
MPDYKIKIPTSKEEWDYISKELAPKIDLYKKFGYSPALPNKINKTDFTKSFSVNSYEKPAQQLSQELPEFWPKLFAHLIELNKAWPFRIFPIYELRLTLYGTGGDYFPSYGAFDGKLRLQPGKSIVTKKAIVLVKTHNKKFTRNPLEIVAHEIVHLGIEESIVKKFSLSHAEKEVLVDRICLILFKDILPNYQLQKITDSRMFNSIANKNDLLNLPQIIRSSKSIKTL